MNKLLVGTHISNQMDVENWPTRAEEIEALAAIYGDDFTLHDDGDEKSFELRFHLDDEMWWSATIYVLLPTSYPSVDPPLLEIYTECLSSAEIEAIEADLQKKWEKEKCENILYKWIERIREMMMDKYELAKAFIESTEEEKEREKFITDIFRADNADLVPSEGELIPKELDNVPEIFSGESFTVKKSTFQGHVARVYTMDDVKQVLKSLNQNRKIANASHNIVAFRLVGVNESSFIQDYADDGEVNAGGRLLHLLQLLDLKNVVVVVSRWYGGILLGPDRFRIISNTARETLINGGLYDQENDKKKSAKKPKAKRKK